MTTKTKTANLFTDYSSTDYTYHIRELTNHAAQMDSIRTAPLADRKEGAKDYADALTDPAHMAERAGWILDGMYGYAASFHAWTSATSPRANTAAFLGILIAALDHGCPADRARSAFLALPAAQQEAINAAIRAEVAEHIANAKEEAAAA